MAELSVPVDAVELTRAQIARWLDSVDQAVTITEAEFRLAAAEARQAEGARDDVRVRMQAIERSIAAQAGAQIELWTEALRDCVEAPAAARAQLLAHRLGLEHALPFADESRFQAFIDNPEAGVVFGAPAAQVSAPAGPTAAVLEQIGTRIEAPSGAADLWKLSSHPDVLAIHPFAGMHVSVPRKAGTYRHHGVLVGDGTVVHFSGEPGKGGEKVIERVAFKSFLKDSPVQGLRVHFPDWEGRDPVPCLQPNLVVLRGLSVMGSSGYQLFNNNCEHFGTWSQCGAMLSEQVDRFFKAGQVKGALAAGPVAGGAMKAYIDAWQMRVDSRSAALVPPSAEVSEAGDVFLDVGRIRWCADNQQLLWYIPATASADPGRLWTTPEGPRDRPWTFDPLDGSRVWHTEPPSTRLNRHWHAALLANANGEVFVVDGNDSWRRTAINLPELLSERAGAQEDLNRLLARREAVFEAPEDPEAPRLPSASARHLSR